MFTEATSLPFFSMISDVRVSMLSGVWSTSRDSFTFSVASVGEAAHFPINCVGIETTVLDMEQFSVMLSVRPCFTSAGLIVKSKK